MILQPIIVYLHSAYMRHIIKWSRHNTRNGIAVEIPTHSELYESPFILYDTVLLTKTICCINEGTYSVLRLDKPENILLCTSRSLFSDKSLRKESSSLRETRHTTKWEKIANWVAQRYNLPSLLLRIDKYHSTHMNTKDMKVRESFRRWYRGVCITLLLKYIP